MEGWEIELSHHYSINALHSSRYFESASATCLSKYNMYITNTTPSAIGLERRGVRRLSATGSLFAPRELSRIGTLSIILLLVLLGAE